MLLTNSPVQFAKVALELTRETLPKYRTKFSKKDFEWPQLVSCLLVRLYFQLDMRGLEQLLSEFSELREALELERVPDHTAFCRALKNITQNQLEALLTNSVVKMARLKPKQGRTLKRQTVVVDSTGMRRDQASRHYQKAKGAKHKRYPKWSIAIDRKTHMILAQKIGIGPSSDNPNLLPLIDAAQKRRKSDELLADAGYDSERNLRLCKNRWKLRGIIAIKVGRPKEKPNGPERRKLKARFPKKRYGQRWQVESVISAHKRRFGDMLHSRTIARRNREHQLRAILHNIAVLF